MPNSPLLADLGRALELVTRLDESKLDFAPDGDASADIREMTGIESYPVSSHKENIQARIDAVVQAGDKLKPRNASNYVSKLIPACVKLGPSVDGRRA